MRGLELFDNRFFAISVAEASAMDPQQRLLLEHGTRSVHASGLQRHDLLGSSTGVFVGITSTEFDQIRPTAGFAIGGVGHCFAAGRLSYVLGLQGPSVAIDTAWWRPRIERTPSAHSLAPPCRFD